MSAMDDYLQLFQKKDSPIRKDWEQLKTNIGAVVPPEQAYKDPDEMQKWALSAALNAPAMATIRPSKLAGVLADLEAKGFDTKMPWYHGGPKLIKKGQWDSPSFFTTNSDDAAWFAMEKGASDEYPAGVINKVFLKRNGALDMRDDYVNGFRETGIPNPKLMKHAENAGLHNQSGNNYEHYYPQISDFSPYDGSNINDLVYHPDFQKYLKDNGYNSLRNWDMLDRGEIDTRMMFDPNDIYNVTTKRPTMLQYLQHKIKKPVKIEGK